LIEHAWVSPSTAAVEGLNASGRTQTRASDHDNAMAMTP